MSTILVIDSNESILALLEIILLRANYRVVIARTGADGVTTARTAQPGAIIMSENLQMASPEDICLQLKMDPETAHIPLILAITANVRDAQGYARLKGADAVLQQPFRANDVSLVLANMLHQ
ncbi:MAG: hypothetical protein K8J31_19335 [Anaerolineae bacterium]|jgi:putative two-component system response regulator|nr:hypothetical protein [Anaerolineae bacterium]